MERRTDAVELLDGPLDDPAALVGNLRDLRRINRWLGGVALTADGDRGPRGAPRRPHAARRRDRRRRHPGRAARPRRAARPAARVPSGVDNRPEVLAAARAAAAGDRDRDGLELARRRRPRRCPTPTDRSTSPTPRSSSTTSSPDDAVDAPAARCAGSRGSASCQRPRAQPARLGRRVADRPPPDRQSATPGTTRRCRSGGPTARPRWRPCSRSAGLLPVRTVRGAFGQRYAIAAVVESGARATIRPGRPTRTARAIRDGRRAGRRRDRRRRPGGRGRWPPGWPRPGATVVVLERSPAWRWRAGGVFASPAAVAALRRAGLDEALLASGRAADPGDARRDAGRDLVPAHLRRGRRRRARRRLRPLAARSGAARPRAARGADVRLGATVTGRGPRSRPAGGARARRRQRRGWPRRSSSAPMACDRWSRARPGVARPVRLGPRVGLTYHLARIATADAPRDARMRVLRDGYVGIAPVPGGRVNVGIVLGASWRPALARDGAEPVAGRSSTRSRRPPDDPAGWRSGRACDAVEGAWPLGPPGHAAGRPRLAPRRRRGRVPRSVHRRGPAPGARVGGAGGPGDPAPAAAGGPRRSPRTTARCGAGSWPRTPSRGSSRRSWRARPGSSTPRGGSPRGRRPCDDGPRHGRPRPGRSGARSALPRRAARAVTDAERTRVAAYALCVDEAGRILLCRMAPSIIAGEVWTLPGGGLQFGESPETRGPPRARRGDRAGRRDRPPGRGHRSPAQAGVATRHASTRSGSSTRSR